MQCEHSAINGNAHVTMCPCSLGTINAYAQVTMCSCGYDAITVVNMHMRQSAHAVLVP